VVVHMFGLKAANALERKVGRTTKEEEKVGS